MEKEIPPLGGVDSSTLATTTTTTTTTTDDSTIILTASPRTTTTTTTTTAKRVRLETLLTLAMNELSTERKSTLCDSIRTLVEQALEEQQQQQQLQEEKTSFGHDEQQGNHHKKNNNKTKKNTEENENHILRGCGHATNPKKTKTRRTRMVAGGTSQDTQHPTHCHKRPHTCSSTTTTTTSSPTTIKEEAFAAAAPSSSLTLNLLHLPHEVLIRIIAMLPTLQDILPLRRVCKFFSLSSSHSLLECALQERLQWLGIPTTVPTIQTTHATPRRQQRQQPVPQQPQPLHQYKKKNGFSLVPNLTLQWISDLQHLEKRGFLVPGTYQLFTSSRDRGQAFAYSAQGQITLHPNGICTGQAVEQCRRLVDEDDDDDDGNQTTTTTTTNHGVPSRIENGRWTLDRIQFEYVYGRHPYAYDLHLQSVVHTCVLSSSSSSQRPPLLDVGLPTAVLQGTWNSCHPDSDLLTEHGTVDQTLLIGPGLGLSRSTGI
ncbi:hypothetical protein ACA910_007046 [Epithemia clementina (nom. ined.)]